MFRKVHSSYFSLMRSSIHNKWVIATGVFMLLGLWVFEYYTHILGNVVYVAVAAVVMWFLTRKSAILFIASWATLLLVIGYVYAVIIPDQAGQSTFLMNRVSAMVAIWFSAYFIVNYQKLQGEKERQREELEQQRLEEERLRSSQEMHEAIAQNFPGGWIGLLNENFIFQLVGGRGLLRIGLTATELVGKSFQDLVPIANVNYHLRELCDGSRKSLEVSIGKRTFEVNACNFKVNKNKSWILFVAHDVTVLKETEVELINTLKKERELHEMKSRFITMASHEFRTPLSTIMTSASLLANYSGSRNDQAIEAHKSRIKNAVKLLTEILDDFLHFERLEQGNVNPYYEKIYLPDFLSELTERVEAMKLVSQKLVIPKSQVTQFYCDRSFLKIMLSNLLSNAFKYSGAEGTVVLDCKAERGRLLFSVRDQGMGIPQEDQAFIFDRFFRGKNASNIQGTGLGLSIALMYAKMLKGTIDFRSDPIIETTFTLSLPLNS